MICRKTGAVVFVESHNNRFIADLFVAHNLMIFRIAGRIPAERHDLHPITHRVTDEIAFLDKDSMSTERNATLIVHAFHVREVEPQSAAASAKAAP